MIEKYLKEALINNKLMNDAVDRDIKIKNPKTLRDEFAIAALQGIIASTSSEDIRSDMISYIQKSNSKTEHFIARYAYSFADAMLKQREVKND